MIKIVADSGCDYSEELFEKNKVDFEIVPLTLQIGDKQYIDNAGLDIAAYLKEMAKSKVQTKTAAPSPELYMEAFKGENPTFAITLTSELSGSFGSAVLAKQMYLDELGEKFIHVFDSLSAAAAPTVIALKIIECAKKKLTNPEIVETVSEFIKNMKTFFILEKYDNLVKSGRVNPYIAKVVSVLNIRPICMANNGKIAQSSQARGFNKAMAKLIEIMQKEKVDFENRILGISHVQCLERALEFKEQVKKVINFKDIFIVEARGVCSTYGDQGGLIISY